MNPSQDPAHGDRRPDENPTPPRSPAARTLLNGLIAALILVIGYLSYALFTASPSPSEKAAPAPAAARVIQLDVLNGCGAKGAGARFTGYLRSNGFDVVEMKNYKTFHVPQTLVVDRVGDLAAARRVASSLGVPEKNVIQQINLDYFVDVSVIIGEDYQNLRPSH